MKLDVIGCAGSYPSPSSACSSYLVSSKGISVLLDSGNGSLTRLFRHVDPSELDAIVISHSHLDHFADLVGIYHYLKFARTPKRPIALYGTLDFQEKFQFLVGREAVDDGVFSMVGCKRGIRVNVGSLTLAFYEGNHSVPTLITRVSDGTSSMCYGADGDESDDLLEAAANVDLLLGESTWVERNVMTPRGLHLDAKGLSSMATKSGATWLVATHIAHPGPHEQVLEIIRNNFAGRCDVAKDGAVFTF